MRDPVLTAALKRLAAEAATHLSSLVATGDQIPFDVAEEAGEDSCFYRYVPLTSKFVREREDGLRALPSFGVACGALAASGVAAPYLEARGEIVPADPDERSARALVVFIASLWDGCAEFALDPGRLDRALRALEAEARDVHEANLLIAPLVGLQMPLARLQLPSGVRIVRADTVDAPLEAMRSEGMQRAPWEPQFLALAEQGGDPQSCVDAMRQLRELVSVMRFFKEGGVGLGPYVFAPTGEGKWRRVATGAPAARPGGYKLSEREAAELAKLARELEARPDPAPGLAWAIARFEMGCERPSALEGLSDHLLALRALLEGQGPVGASLPMRAAALLADEEMDRVEAGSRVEAALLLERNLMHGAAPSADGKETASWVEGAVRRLLRAAALGELGTDVGAAADEALIVSGLAEGDIEIAVNVQTGEEDEREAGIEVEAGEREDAQEEDYMEDETRILEPVPAEDEIRITATNWLDEVSRDATLEWPAASGERGPRERIDTPRVRHLFPVPEDAEWEVRELDYDHYERRRAAGS